MRLTLRRNENNFAEECTFFAGVVDPHCWRVLGELYRQLEGGGVRGGTDGVASNKLRVRDYEVNPLRREGLSCCLLYNAD